MHNGIIYGRVFGVVTLCNIETGQRIQEFRFELIGCFTVNDQYLIASDESLTTDECKLNVLDLQTNNTYILSDQGEQPQSLCIYNNKLVSVDNDSTIKI